MRGVANSAISIDLKIINYCFISPSIQSTNHSTQRESSNSTRRAPVEEDGGGEDCTSHVPVGMKNITKASAIILIMIIIAQDKFITLIDQNRTTIKDTQNKIYEPPAGHRWWSMDHCSAIDRVLL